MSTVIEVSYKEGVFDAGAEAVKKDISDLGIKGARSISTHQLYSIEGDPKEKDLEFIAGEILSDPVTQVYRINSSPDANRQDGAGGVFSVEVWLKKGVTDNVGSSVKKAISDLELKGVLDVSSGRKYLIKGKLSKSDVVSITTRLLANEVVEEYRIHGEK